MPSRFKPWVGKRYRDSRTRLLVVGESHYGFTHDDQPNFTVDTIEKWRRGDDEIRHYGKLAHLLKGSPVTPVERKNALGRWFAGKRSWMRSAHYPR